jgi:hypothetical protein
MVAVKNFEASIGKFSFIMLIYEIKQGVNASMSLVVRPDDGIQNINHLWHKRDGRAS